MRWIITYLMHRALDYRGGSGHSFDWSLLKQVNIPLEKVILAGGLRVENIAQAIMDVQPFAVDVSSGVEQDGEKGCHTNQSNLFKQLKERVFHDNN